MQVTGCIRYTVCQNCAIPVNHRGKQHLSICALFPYLFTYLHREIGEKPRRGTRVESMVRGDRSDAINDSFQSHLVATFISILH